MANPSSIMLTNTKSSFTFYPGRSVSHISRSQHFISYLHESISACIATALGSAKDDFSIPFGCQYQLSARSSIGTSKVGDWLSKEISVHLLYDRSVEPSRHGTGAAYNAPWVKAMLGIVVIALVGVAVILPLVFVLVIGNTTSGK